MAAVVETEQAVVILLVLDLHLPAVDMVVKAEVLAVTVGLVEEAGQQLPLV